MSQGFPEANGDACGDACGPASLGSSTPRIQSSAHSATPSPSGFPGCPRHPFSHPRPAATPNLSQEQSSSPGLFGCFSSGDNAGRFLQRSLGRLVFSRLWISRGSRWGVCSFHSCVPTGGSLLHSRGTWPSCLPIPRLPGGWLHWPTGARFSPYLGFWWATQSEDPPIPLFLQGPLRPFPPPKCFCWNAPTWIFCH